LQISAIVYVGLKMALAQDAQSGQKLAVISVIPNYGLTSKAMGYEVATLL
jgi:hypothetical protein